MKENEQIEAASDTEDMTAVCKQLHREIKEELIKLLKNPGVPKDIKEDVVKLWKGENTKNKSERI